MNHEKTLLKKAMKLFRKGISSRLHGYIYAVVLYGAIEVDTTEEFNVDDEGLKATSNA